MSVFQQLLGIQPQQAGGVLGAAMQQQPQGYMAQQQPMAQAKPKFWQTPEFASTLSRLGANLSAASTNNEGFLDALSLASAQTQKDTEAARAQAVQNELLQAQIGKARADAQPSSPFSGTGFENQVAGTYYQAYLQQGLSPMEAQVKAAQAVFNREPSYVTNAEGQLVPIPGRTLPTFGEQPAGASRQAETIPAQAMPNVQSEALPPPSFMGGSGQQRRAPDAIDHAAASLGIPSGMLLPPPVAGGSGQIMPSINAPQVGGPKTQQAITQAAGEAQISLGTKDAERLQEKNSLLPKATGALQSAVNDIDRTIGAIDSLLPQVSGATAGLGGTMTGFIPGTPSRDVTAALKTIKASAAFNALQEMRNNSPTGGALGSIAVPELELLQNSLAAVEQDQSPEALRRNLIKVREEYQKMRGRAVNAFQQDFGKVIQEMPTLPNAPQGITRPQSKAEFDALPKGSRFFDPDGNERIKP